MIPIEQSLLYIRPLYVSAEGTPLPQLKKVIVVYGEKVIMRDSLRAALTEIFGSSPPTLELQGPGVPLPPVAGVGTPPPGGGTAPGPPGGVDATVQSLLDQATAKFTAADEALRKGDLAGYQRENDAAKA